MAPDERLSIAPGLDLPRSELEFRATRSGGPGGQHVNTSSTRVEVWWDISRSPTLSEQQRIRLTARLGTRLDGSGRLRLVSSTSRSQLRNREEVTERLVRVVAEALRMPKQRKRTKPTRAAREKRLDAKRRRGATKRQRRRRPDEE